MKTKEWIEKEQNKLVERLETEDNEMLRVILQIKRDLLSTILED